MFFVIKNCSKRAKKEAEDQAEAEHEDRNVDEPEDGENISESEEENPINFTINQESDNLFDNQSVTDTENSDDDEPILNVYGSFWNHKLVCCILYDPYNMNHIL